MTVVQPEWLWLLVVPLFLLVMWVRQVVRRRRDVNRLVCTRQVPVRQRFPIFGESLFWLCLIVATALVISALARPAVVTSLVRKGGLDLIILLDGSASMHVRDVAGNRWQRSMRFLRVLGDSLRWEDSDRIAMTLFARHAAPQIRLTRDPNTFFFFLDHLAEEPPFSLEDDSSWDTNIELGITQGLRMIAKDTELNGPSKNAPLFVLITDGQAWSGSVEKALLLARKREVPVFVIGVGTLSGGFIPEPPRPALERAVAPPPPVFSILDRGSLKKIANLSDGLYVEMDRSSDVNVSNQIIDAARRRIRSLPADRQLEELYWRLLAAAGCVGLAGLLFLRDRSEVWIQVAGGSLVLASMALILT